jgi:HD-like signal output (HDOD) protein
MAAKILQLVNSAYFGAGQQISSVPRAVTYLGIELIQGLALTAHVFDAMNPPEIASGLSLSALQAHSLVTARLASSFVTEPKRGEEAFAAAIVHDIGKIILALGFPDHYAQILTVARDERRPVWEVEQEALGVSHAEVGGYLLGVWGLPFSIVEAVTFHHNPRGLVAGPYDLLAAVHVADGLAHGAAGDEGKATDRSALDWDFLRDIGMAGSVPEWKAIAVRELDTLVEAR